MAFKDLSDLNDMQIDVLKEIGNIGSGNAATSLSSMLMHPVGIEVPHIAILDYNEVVEALGGPESMIVSLMLFLSGEVEGMIMFLLQKDFAHMTLSSLLGEDVGDFNGEDEMANSALTEVGNIMAASFVNAIGTLTGLNISISVPDICIDMCGAILSVPAIHYANISDKIIFIQDQFNSMSNEATSHVLLIPDVESLSKIMTNLGIEL
ncbi:MAG: chemotaxis protein CheC [Provencibacterium sp.]|jgi:chemotaxis protein CheC|nr:chemotaxis protein CheC [Provencibacterium sp.]